MQCSERYKKVPLKSINPVSPTSDLGRISPYTISTTSSRQIILIGGLLVNQIPNSPN